MSFDCAGIMSFRKIGNSNGSKLKILLCGRFCQYVNQRPLVFPTSLGVCGKILFFQREKNEDFVVVDLSV